MKLSLQVLGVFCILQCCNTKSSEQQSSIDIQGTWQLISGTIIEKSDTTFTDYTKGHRMIKIINKTHFSFLNHDLTKGKDSTTLFIAGGGRYELDGDQYTEHLEYCSDRMWEENDFKFTVKIQNDTLIQSGVEKIKGTNVNRMNIEKYMRVK